MKTFCLIVLVFFCTIICHAQKPLTNSRQSSYYTYLYKINDADLLKRYQQPDTDPKDTELKHPVDSFKTGKYWENKLPAGNYYKVYAEKNRLVYKLIENHSAFLRVLANTNELQFSLADKVGNAVTGAQVTVNGKPVIYDVKAGVYRCAHPGKHALLIARYAGVSNFYKLGEDNDEVHHTYLYMLWKKIAGWFKKDRRNTYKPDKPNLYNSFMLTNKPKYKPRDTVKFKAFILLEKSKRPVSDQKLLVRLSRNYYSDDDSKVIGYVSNYRPGGFEGNIVLADSLGLRLDNNYVITLENPLTATYNADDHTEEQNREFNRKNKLARVNFKYEEYELKSTQFAMRTDKKEHGPGNLLAIYLKATDENSLPVPDGRVNLVLTTNNFQSSKLASVFVPDTLWQHKVTLEPVGETRVLVPDSIFPKADINYQINANFLNSSNESQSAYQHIKYTYERYHIKLDIEKDSLIAKAYEWGKEVKLPALISATNDDDDTLSNVKVMLPARLKINPYAHEYAAETDSAYDAIELDELQANLNLSGYRTADSVFVQVANPRRIPFWYSLYDGKKIVDAGYADTLDYRRKHTGSNNLTFVCNYVWAGKMRSSNYTLVYQDKLLNINVQQPLSVYPGQQVKTEIEIKDAKGKPVANTDVTAWSVTRKFTNYNLPNVPYMGKARPYIRFKDNLPLDELNDGNIKLNWNRWSREIGLDSIAYFRFTHPHEVYQIAEPAPDQITQIAPFVTDSGEVVPVHILYIDERPVYFSQAEQLQQYSFRVNPGRHSLRFRTQKKSILVDTIIVEKGKKLIISFNANALADKNIHVLPMPDTLAYDEAGMLNKYMIQVADNFTWQMAQLKNDDNLILLNPVPRNYYTGRSILAGPLMGGVAQFNIYGNNPLSFVTEPNYTYLFEPGLLKQTSIKTKYPFSTNLNRGEGATNYKQYVLTAKGMDSLWHDYLDNRSQKEQLFMNTDELARAEGRLNIRINSKKDESLFIRNVIIYSYTNPDFIRVLRGTETNMGRLNAGKYRLFFLLKGDRYAVEENINIKPYGNNYYAFTLRPKPADSVSKRISEIISSRPDASTANDRKLNNDALKLKETFNEKYIAPKSFTYTMTGQVIDETKEGLIGVTVKVKGTPHGVTTDVKGNFTIKVPASGKLLIAYIGYETTETNILPNQSVTIKMKASKAMLQEVVVVGYGTEMKRSLSGAVAGLSVTSYSTASIQIRGNSSINGNAPLYIVDGMPVASIAGISPDSIGEISVLKDAAATAIYGARAANGVVIINTKKKGAKADGTDATPQNQQTMRKNFADYAYWQPRLTTNAEGKASFTSVFPDDITNWRTFVIAINGNRQTGVAESQIKAFKSLSANFIAPQFAVKGDELSAIGKVMNYNTESIKLTRTFKYNGKEIKSDVLNITSSKIDTLKITAAGTDSLAFEYTIKRDNGYFDGELRKIPLIEAGVIETKGNFAALEQDTTVNMKFDPALGPVTFRAEASLLPVLLEETERLRNYRYLCNEQLASKLKGLLMQERIKGYLKEEFKYKKNVEDLIKKLSDNAQTTGLWSWWKTGDEELWISLHAIEALTEAQRLGYSVNIDKPKLTSYLVYQLEGYNHTDKIQALQILKKLDAKVDYERYAAAMQKEMVARKYVSRYDRYRFLLMQQQLGLPVKIDTLMASHKTTMFGNLYWGDDSYRFFDNSIQLSLLAYQLFANEGKHPQVLSKIRGFLLEQRKNNEWRNTYESALILEALLPGLLQGGKQVKPAALTLTGGINQGVKQFPYTASFNGTNLGISKTGTLPVYVTAYQQFFNHEPQKVSKDFTVDTRFEINNRTVTKLKGGEQVQLKAEVSVRADADFVMIEIPIPAGCSYQSKEQAWGSNEVHREYFKEKVSIFCRKLKQGKYTYIINLMPRYNGAYTLNPAKAEMMYFPVFYGRESMKKVAVE
jgi:TonB-dependent SusC/RagA subfamily outer membrane receptor